MGRVLKWAVLVVEMGRHGSERPDQSGCTVVVEVIGLYKSYIILEWFVLSWTSVYTCTEAFFFFSLHQCFYRLWRLAKFTPFLLAPRHAPRPADG